MTAMDVIAHTSIAPEPFGRVIVEAMLARRPIIASAAGGVLEIISNGVDGVLVAPGDVEALAREIQRLHSNPTLCSDLTKSGYATARNRFDPDVYCHHVLERLETVGGFTLSLEPQYEEELAERAVA